MGTGFYDWLAEHKAAGIRRGWQRRTTVPRGTFSHASDIEIDHGYRMVSPVLRMQLLERDIALADRYPDEEWSGPMRDRAIRLLSEMKEK